MGVKLNDEGEWVSWTPRFMMDWGYDRFPVWKWTKVMLVNFRRSFKRCL